MTKIFKYLSGILALVSAGLITFIGIKNVQKTKKEKKKAEILQEKYKNNAKEIKTYDKEVKKIEKQKKELEKQNSSDIISTVISRNNELSDDKK